MWDKLAKGALLFFSGVVMIAIGLLFVPQWKKHKDLHDRLEDQQAKRANYEAQLQDYRVRQERFQTEPAYVEQVAYEIGMVKSDQIIFKFYDDQDTYDAVDAN